MNSKGELQEFCQRRGCEVPTYSSVSSEGPSHSPLFVREVTLVWEGKTLTQRGEGRSKKDAEKVAAHAMLQLIQADTECADPYNEPVPSPSRYKVVLGELLQRDHHPTPHYTLLSERGPPHKKEFTVKCTISRGREELEQVGVGSTKKIAESKAAKNMLSLLQDGVDLQQQPTQVGASCTLSDPRVDTVLRGQEVTYEHRTGEGGMFLCLALAQQLAAHGRSLESKEQAQTQAMNNLAISIETFQ